MTRKVNEKKVPTLISAGTFFAYKSFYSSILRTRSSVTGSTKAVT